MSKSLRFQARWFSQFFGVMALIAVLFLFYTQLIYSSSDFWGISYRIMCCFLLFFLSMIYMQNHTASFCGIAISFGATRRGWYFSSLLFQLVYAVLVTVLLGFILFPLGNIVYKEELAVPFQLILFLFALCVLGQSFGGFTGLVARRYGGKVLVLAIVLFFIVAISLAIAGAVVAGEDMLFAVFASAAPSVVMLALCVPLQLISWRWTQTMTA